MTKDARHHELITTLQDIRAQLADLADAIVSLGSASSELDRAVTKLGYPLNKYLPPETKPWYSEHPQKTTYPAPSDDSAD